jgi:hypothetical protein
MSASLATIDAFTSCEGERAGARRQRFGGRVVRGRWKSAVLAALLALSSQTCPALTLLDTISDWTCSSESERFALTNMLALTASHGRPELGAPFFTQCMEDAAAGSFLRPAQQINAIAAACVWANLVVFSESG